MIPDASKDLMGYKRWLRELQLNPLPIGTVLRWERPHMAIGTSNITIGQCYKVEKLNESIHPGAKCYQLVLCSENGREFKKKQYWSFEGIARRLDNGEVAIIPQAKPQVQPYPYN
jgi:hypothetical protein